MKERLCLRSARRSSDHFDDDVGMIPPGMVGAMLDKYTRDIEEEKYYPQMPKRTQSKSSNRREERKLNTRERRLAQHQPAGREIAGDLSTAGYTRPTTDERVFEQSKEDDYRHDYEENKHQEFDMQPSPSLGSHIEEGFSKDFNKSNRAKRQKWGKSGGKAVACMNANQKVNARTAAQLDRISNI